MPAKSANLCLGGLLSEAKGEARKLVARRPPVCVDVAAMASTDFYVRYGRDPRGVSFCPVFMVSQNKIMHHCWAPRRYYVGHKGKFGHEFLEFEFRPDGKVRSLRYTFSL